MKWIGLTGGIGSGKSTVAKALRSQGFAVLDADEMARRAVTPGAPALTEIAKAFGQKILKSDGSLDRKAMADVVFSDPSQLEILERIIHPHIQALVRTERRELENIQTPMAFYDIPLLYEKSLESQFDAVVVVDCPEPIRIQRVMKRDGLSEAEVRRRLASQKPLEEKVKRAHYVIVNDGDEAALNVQIATVVAKIRSAYQPQA